MNISLGLRILSTSYTHDISRRLEIAAKQHDAITRRRIASALNKLAISRIISYSSHLLHRRRFRETFKSLVNRWLCFWNNPRRVCKWRRQEMSKSASEESLLATADL